MIEDTNLTVSGKLDVNTVNTALGRYDELWIKWRNLKQSSKECATIYTDLAFKNNKSGSIGELVDNFRFKVKKY